MEITKFYYNKWYGVGSPLGFAIYLLGDVLFHFKDYRNDPLLWLLPFFVFFLGFLMFYIFKFYLPGSRGAYGLTINAEKIDDAGHTRVIFWRDVVSVKKRRFSNYIHIETIDGALFKINIGQYTTKGPVIFKTFLNYFEKYGSSNAPGILLVSQ